jgi:hypothetical protein
MARASRSNKKQPAFDPSELTDLIFTPAVGSGVGSHLVGSVAEVPAPIDRTSVDTLTVPTVDKSDMSTIDGLEIATVGKSDMTTVAMPHMATMDTSDATTVGKSDIATVGKLAMATVVVYGKTTMDIAEMTTVANEDMSTVATAMPGQGRELWVTEDGGVVPKARVKRILVAQDVISSSEAFVYDTLWTAGAPESADGPSRVVQAGYDYLVKHTELSKRTIQRIVEKLIDKDFIAIERPADIYQRSSTVYRVFNYQTVLDRHLEKGRLHVAKVGPGLSYARPLSLISPQ